MTVRVNGESKSFAGCELGLVDLLEQLGFDQRPVLVEYNGKALRQREHADVTVSEGDRLEIILIVAGG